METDKIDDKNNDCRDDSDTHTKFADGVGALAKKCGIEGYVLHSFTEDDESVTHLQVCENVCGQKILAVVKRTLEAYGGAIESAQDTREVH